MDKNSFRGADIRLIEKPPLPNDAPDLSTLPPLPPETRVLHVDYVWSPLARLQSWNERESDGPAEVEIVHTGYAVTDAETVENYGESIGLSTSFTYVTHPRDLQQIGLEIVKFLDRAEAETHPTVVCVDSLSLMLQYASVDAVAQFVEACLDRLRSRGTVGRLYFTPATHEAETVELIRSLFAE